MQRRSFLAGMGGMAVLGSGIAKGAGKPRWYAPDEAHPHLRTFMQWPVSRRIHHDQVFREMLQRAVARIANVIVEFEPVVMLTADSHHRSARKMLSSAVELWHVPTEDLWARDSGPLFVNDGAGNQQLVTLNFNGWGDKQEHLHDGKVATRVARALGLPLTDHGVTGEPGGVESDGAGLLMAHESSWVNPNRNKAPRDVIEERLLSAYGAERMIWAPGVKGLDITDYHIDALARFVAPGVALIQLPDEVTPGDPFSRAAWETHDILQASPHINDVIVIPEPRTARVTAEDFVASYVNYYVCNGAVIAAQFGDRTTDAMAEDTLRKLYPGRQIIMMNVDAIGEVGGGIHCATQQQPVP
ncbi:MAG: agmatine deiminase family protein [Pikeienuella sp.]